MSDEVTVNLPTARLLNVETDAERRALGRLMRECPRSSAWRYHGREKAARLKAMALRLSCGYERHGLYTEYKEGWGTVMSLVCLLGEAAWQAGLPPSTNQHAYDLAVRDAVKPTSGAPR